MCCAIITFIIFLYFIRDPSPLQELEYAGQARKKTASGERHLTPIKGEMDEMHIL